MARKAMGAILVMATAALVTGLAWAQMDLPVIKEQKQGEVRYLVGGVGTEEREYMQSQASNYNLKLVFAVASREYLAGVKVVILDPNGKTYVTTTTDGPWMMVRLPEGDYLVQATSNGQTQVQKLKLGKALQTLNFHWKQ